MRATQLAGAGELVTKLIASELGFDNMDIAESVKRHPLAKVESLFQVRLEDGTLWFYKDPLPADVFARVVALEDDGGMLPIPTRHSLHRIRTVRREAKRRVFVVNALRALERVAPQGSMRAIDFVVLLGGSALDFEIPEMIAAATAEHGIVCGTGNVRGSAANPQRGRHRARRLPRLSARADRGGCPPRPSRTSGDPRRLPATSRGREGTVRNLRGHRGGGGALPKVASGAGFEAIPLTERAGRGIWRAIVKVADERDAKVVVVGSHGKSAAVSAVLGSVSHGVVSHCRRPVLVAPCSGDHPDGEG